MQFTFSNKELKNGFLASLIITRQLGNHSMMILEFRLNDHQPDLGGLLGDDIQCEAREGSQQFGKIFDGVITSLEYTTSQASTVTLKLEAQSKSVLSDMIPRSRVFQDPNAKLRDIINHVSSEGEFEVEIIDEEVTDQKDVLSIQFNESDFDYIKRIVEIHGTPIIVNDLDNKILIGQPNDQVINLDKKQVVGSKFIGNVIAFASDAPDTEMGGGVLESMQDSAGQFFSTYFGNNLSPYTTNTAFPKSQELHKELIKATDNSRFFCQGARRIVRTKPVFLSVGDRVNVYDDETTYSVFSTMFSFHYKSGPQTQHTLVASANLVVDRDPVVLWWSEAFLAKVVKNSGDPEKLGRVQVQFDWETESDSAKCWVDVLTPYAGSEGNQTYGFISLPEVGEQVIVRFLESWDDKPYIIGSLRRGELPGELDTAKSKSLYTPQGTRLTMLSDRGEERIQIRAGDGEEDNIEIVTSNNETQIHILSPKGSITLEAKEKLDLKAREINLDGSVVNVEGDRRVKVKGNRVDIDN